MNAPRLSRVATTAQSALSRIGLHRSASRAPVPYEHRGAEIRTLSMLTLADLTLAVARFRSESDPWLRKMLAQRILQHPEVDSLRADLRECLQDALTCRVI